MSKTIGPDSKRLSRRNVSLPTGKVLQKVSERSPKLQKVISKTLSPALKQNYNQIELSAPYSNPSLAMPRLWRGGRKWQTFSIQSVRPQKLWAQTETETSTAGQHRQHTKRKPKTGTLRRNCTDANVEEVHKPETRINLAGVMTVLRIRGIMLCTRFDARKWWKTSKRDYSSPSKALPQSLN